MTLGSSLLIIFCTLIATGLAFGFFQALDNEIFLTKLNGFGNFLLFICGGPFIWLLCPIVMALCICIDGAKKLKLTDKLKQICYREEYKPVKTPVKPKEEVLLNMTRNVKVDIPKKGWFS